MQVSKISKLNYQVSKLQNLKQKETSVEQEPKSLKNIGYTDLVFNGAIKLAKPQFRTPVQQKIASKISTYLRILPEESRLKSPLVMNMDNKTVEFLMDKTTGPTKVSLKMIDENNKTTFLNMTIDSRGQVRCGAYREDNGSSTIFERYVNRLRRIQFGDAYYRAAGDNDDVWIRMLNHFDETISHDAPARKKFNDTELQEILSEMAKKNASFLAK